jgi:hypothetical protein
LPGRAASVQSAAARAGPWWTAAGLWGRIVSDRGRWRLGIAVAATAGVAMALARDEWAEKRVSVVIEGRLIRGAWQRPGPLKRLLRREKVRTIVTLTAINRDDPKFVAQERVVREAGVGWVIVPMRGSSATLEQMVEAADLLADPARQPIFFHCVAGHHRTGLVHAAYRIRHQGWSAEAAWRELAALPWARPVADGDDRRLIEAFARRYGPTRPRDREVPRDEQREGAGPLGRPAADRGGDRAAGVRRLAVAGG